MTKNNTFHKIINQGHRLLLDNEFEEALNLISNHLRDFVGAERCSIFIYNDQEKELWTIHSTGIEKIHVPTDKGIVGYVFRTKESIIENNVAKNIHFLSDIDKQSGYQTRNLIACPIFNSKNKIQGVLQLLNKLDRFDEDDLEFVNIFAHYLGILIELTPFYLKK